MPDVVRPAAPVRIAVVRNPSKFDEPDQARREVEEAFAAQGLPAPTWYETTEDDPGSGPTKQALADGADVVAAQGGDGTVRACAAVLAGGDVPLALLPAGTGNLLARNLDVPRDLDGAVAVLADGASREIDVIELDGEPFVVMGGSGFDAHVFEATSDDLKARIGWGAYVVAGLRAVREAKPHVVDLRVDGRSSRVRTVGVVVGNVSTLTGGVELLPEADADDGRLHVAVLTPLRMRDWFGLVGRLVTRRDPRSFQMRVLSGRDVVVGWPREVPVEIDGDLVEPRRELTFTVVAGSLPVRVPTSTS